MEKTTIEIIKITPSEGMVLTNGETYSEDFVHVGRNDSIDNWYEITKEEYKAILKEQEKQMEEKINGKDNG